MPNSIILIIIIICLVLIANIIRIAYKSARYHFECPNCGEHFKVSFTKYFFTAHFFGGRCEVKCPKCGKHNMLKALP